jgi:hypothetical protein
MEDYQDSQKIIDSSSVDLSNNSMFGFSKYLFSKREFDNSILELERIKFLNSKDEIINAKSEILIGINLLSKKDLENTRRHLDKINSSDDSLQFNKNILLLVLGDLQRTFLWNENFLKSLSAQTPKYNNLYSKFDFYNDLRLGKTDEIKEIDSLGFALSKESFDNIIYSFKNIKTKSPFLSGMMSAIIPGSGYIYVGEVKEGISALLVNSLLGAGIYALFKNGNTGSGILTSLVAAPFYFGNILGSVNAAHLNNSRNKEVFFNSLRFQIGIDFYFSEKYFLTLW